MGLWSWTSCQRTSQSETTHTFSHTVSPYRPAVGLFETGRVKERLEWKEWKMNRNSMFPLWHWHRLIMISWMAKYRPHKKHSWLPFRKTVPQWCAHLAAVGAEQELMIRTKKWMQQICESQWISVVPLVFESATMHNTAVILVWTSSPISATFPSQQCAIPGYHGSSGGTPLILCTKTRAAHMAGLC